MLHMYASLAGQSCSAECARTIDRTMARYVRVLLTSHEMSVTGIAARLKLQDAESATRPRGAPPPVSGRPGTPHTTLRARQDMDSPCLCRGARPFSANERGSTAVTDSRDFRQTNLLESKFQSHQPVLSCDSPGRCRSSTCNL